MTTIDMTQFNRGARAFVDDDMPDDIAELRHAIADTVKEEVERLTPRRTGKAARSWEQHEERKPYGVDIVGNDVFYLKFLDEGTVKQRPLHIRRRAADKAIAKHGGRR